MDLDKLTIGEAREIARVFSSNESAGAGPWVVGRSYLIRTVTYAALGKLVEIHPSELVLDTASWVADTGRFHVAIRDGELREVEPVGDSMIVGRGAIVDAFIWTHALPTEPK